MQPAPSEENKTYEEYKDHPSDLFKEAGKMFDKDLYEEGVQILEKAINFALTKFGSISDPHMGIYYARYAEGLIQKLMQNDDLFNKNEEKENEKKSPEEGNKNAEKTNGDLEDGPLVIDENKPKENPNENQKENSPEAEGEETDEEVIIENLLAALGSLTGYLKEYDNEKDVSKLSPEVIQFYKDLASVYLIFGELDKARSDFKNAAEHYLKAVEIRKKYDKKYSRDLAELYFNLAFVYDYDPRLCLLSFFKAKVIMEYHLNEELKKSNFPKELKIEEEDLELTEINENDPKLFLNKSIVESEEVKELSKENSEVDNLIYVLDSLYTKIEDAGVACSTDANYKKEKEELIEKSGVEGKFSENYDKENVVDITSMIKKKRPRSPELNQMENEELSKDTKKPKIEDEKKE